MTNKSERPIDSVLKDFDAQHHSSTNKTIQILTIPFLIFGFVGIIWAIPFPYLAFLGKYNGFVNWASFVIAFSIYYYYRLSPVLSYMILLAVFAISAGIVGLEKLEKQGVLTLKLVCLVIFILAMVVQYFGYTKEKNFPTLKNQLNHFLNAPIWLAAQLFKVFKVKF